MLSEQGGYTYFIQSGRRGPVKIGFTRRDPVARLWHLQTGSAERLRLLHVLHGNWEPPLRRAFASSRLRGEWFAPDHITAFLCELKAERVTPPSSQAELEEVVGSCRG